MRHIYNLTSSATGFVFSSVGLFAVTVAFYLFSPGQQQISPGIAESIISVCGLPSPDRQVDAALLALEDDFVYADTGRIHWGISPYPQPVPNSEAQTALVDGKLYSFGGFDKKKRCCTPTDRAYVFDPASGWSPIKSMPAMNGTEHGGVTHAGFTTDGTDIYFAGGYTSNENGYGQIFGTEEVWKYDIAADDYFRMPDLPEPLSAGELEYIGGKLYWVAGTNLARTKDLGTQYVLDLSDTTGQHSAEGWQPLASMPNPRNHLGSAVYDGKLYVFGGQHGHDGKLVTQNSVHCYDPATDSWTEKASMPKALSHITGATFTYGDQIFVMGGEQANGPKYYVSDVVAYNPLTDDWTLYPGMPAKRTSGVAGVIDGKIYYSTGYGSKTTFVGDLLEIAVPGVPTDSTEACMPAGIWLEAECANMVGTAWKQYADMQASAGSYLAVPAGTNNIEQAGEARRAVLRYQFTVDTSADYTVYGRALVPEGNQNSFWIKVDDDAWQEWSVALADTMSWSQTGTYLLDSGSHRLSISYREGGTGLDKILITADTCAPMGVGSDTTDICMVEDNQIPVARAGADTTLYAGSDSTATVTLDASASEDADGEIVMYSWSQEAEPVADTAAITPVLPVGTHTFLLTVEDERGATAMDTVVVTVIEEEVTVPEPPTANAGLDTTIFAEADSILVTLDGSVSTDPDGELTAYTWMIANDTIAEGMQPQVNLPVGIHEIVLEVMDDQGLTDTSRVVITIEENPILEIVHAEWLEAECADTLGNHWVVTSDADASNDSYLSFEGSYVYTQDDASFSREDIATYHFSVDENDTYYIFGHARSSDSENSQLWIQFNNGEWIPWDMRMLEAGFNWQALPDSIALDSGSTYTLKIAAQGKLGLDKLYISSKNSLNGVEDIVVGCENEPVTVVVGLKEEPATQDIAVYPNPGRGIYTVALPDDAVSFKGQMKISSMDGKIIRQLPIVVNGTGHATLDLSGVGSGIYLLQLWIGDEIWVKRIEKL